MLHHTQIKIQHFSEPWQMATDEWSPRITTRHTTSKMYTQYSILNILPIMYIIIPVPQTIHHTLRKTESHHANKDYSNQIPLSGFKHANQVCFVLWKSQYTLPVAGIIRRYFSKNENGKNAKVTVAWYRWVPTLYSKILPVYRAEVMSILKCPNNRPGSIGDELCSIWIQIH
jgi:hypothetical protein